MWRDLGKGLLARLLSYGAFGLGFWLLFKGFAVVNYFQIAGGVILVPVGMYLMVQARRKAFTQYKEAINSDSEEIISHQGAAHTVNWIELLTKIGKGTPQTR